MSRRNTELREAVGAFNASDLVTASCLADNVLSQTRLELEEKIHRFYGVTLFEPDRPDRLVENYRVKEEQLERVPAPPVIGLRFETFHNGEFNAGRQANRIRPLWCPAIYYHACALRRASKTRALPAYFAFVHAPSLFGRPVS